jgi:hypothetical protein
VAQSTMAPALGSWEPVICRVEGCVSKSVIIAEGIARGLLMELRKKQEEENGAGND